MKGIKFIVKILIYFILVLFGIFMFIYGGYDDSLGGQLLGLIMFCFGIYGFIRLKKNK